MQKNKKQPAMQEGQVTSTTNRSVSFMRFFFMVRWLIRNSHSVPYYYNKTSFDLVHAYFDPYSGMPMFGCLQKESLFSVAARSIYEDDSCVQLIDMYNSLNPIENEESSNQQPSN